MANPSQEEIAERVVRYLKGPRGIEQRDYLESEEMRPWVIMSGLGVRRPAEHTPIYATMGRFIDILIEAVQSQNFYYPYGEINWSDFRFRIEDGFVEPIGLSGNSVDLNPKNLTDKIKAGVYKND